MALIPQTKCSRCDRNYSGLRTRCPYCGAHRHKKGKRVSDNDNATWKLIIGVILIVVLIAAVVVILVTSLNGEDVTPSVGDSSGSGAPSSGEDYSSVPGVNPSGSEDPSGSGSPSGSGDTSGTGDTSGGETDASVRVTSANLRTRYGAATDFTLIIGETQLLTCVMTPSNATSVPVWSSSDDSVAAIVPTDETGVTANVTGVTPGTVTITVIVDGIEMSCIVRVKAS